MREHPFKSAVVVFVALTAAFLQFRSSAQAALITATITGTVTDPTAFYQARTLGPIVNLNGDPFTLVYTIDDTKGQQPAVQTNSSGIPISSSITNLGASNPITAVLNIDGHSFSYGTAANSLTTSSAGRRTGDALLSGAASFSVSDRLIVSTPASPITSVGNGIVGVNFEFNNPSLNPDYRWQSELTYTFASPPTLPNGGFTFLHNNIDPATGAEQATGLLTATGLTVSALVEPPPPPPPPVSPQIVYLDFGPNSNAIFNADNAGIRFSDRFSKADSELSPEDQRTVMAAAQSIFGKYLVDFVATPPPPDSSFYTIYIGGSPQDLTPQLQAHLGLNPCTVFSTTCTDGIAQTNSANTPTNIGSSTSPLLTTQGLVFSDNPTFSRCGGPCDPNLRLIGQVVAHETGHLLGLNHVVDDKQLMYPDMPFAPFWNGSDRNFIGGSSLMPNGIPQDSDAYVSCYIGLRATMQRDCIGLPSNGFITLNVLAASLSRTLFNASLTILSTSGDLNELPLLVSLGTILPGQEIHLRIPLSPGDRILLAGQITDGGPAEIFSANYSGFPADGEMATFDVTDPLLTQVSEPSNVILFLLGGGIALWLNSGRRRFA